MSPFSITDQDRRNQKTQRLARVLFLLMTVILVVPVP